MVDRPDRYVFPPFELDVRNCELRRDGVVVKVPPQPFTALALLVRRAGTLVTRDELRVEIWGDDRHVDFGQCSDTSAVRRGWPMPRRESFRIA